MAIILNNQPVDSQKDLFTTNDVKSGNPPSAFRNFDDKTLYEPQRDNHFEFVVEFSGNDRLLKFGKATDDTASSSESAYLDNASEFLRVSLKTAFLPQIGVNPINVKRGNSDIVFAGSPIIGHSGNISFNDWIGIRTYDICLAWSQLVYNMKTDKVGLAQDYKRVAHIFQYTPTWQLVRAWKLNGVFPTNVQGGELNYEGGNAQMQVQMTLSYDNFEIDYSALDNTTAVATTRLATTGVRAMTR